MSNICIKASVLATQSELYAFEKFLRRITGCGNDSLEIICDIDIPELVLDTIKQLHLSDGNKSLKLLYLGEN